MEVNSFSDQIQNLTDQVKNLRCRVDELVNDLALSKEENQHLKNAVAILTGRAPKPKISPGKLDKPKDDDKKDKGKGPGRGKHPRKNKKKSLTIHQERTIEPLFLPKEARFKGYKIYDVQDIICRPNNTRFLLARWQLPDGTYISGELPKGIHGHYGPELISYILNDYYGCRVTEELLLDKLRERGVLISAGQLNNILIENKNVFHEEKKELLSAGIEAHNQVWTDDTGGRHKGKNQYTNVIGNEWFSVFNTTESKSRVNFLRLLQGGSHECIINEDTIAYIEGMNPSTYLSGYIALSMGDTFYTQEEWEQFLIHRNITKESEVRLVTEAALFAALFEKGLPRDLGIHADDAGQFDIYSLHASLCWVHEDRHYGKIIPIDDQAKAELDAVRDRIWSLYRELKAFKENPNETAAIELKKRFDELFQTKTSSSTLNKRLRMTYEKKAKLLMVLARPDTPLHNNSSESDARAAVIRRKISGGTRSDTGRDCRDTFLSLKQTCRKLRVNFIDFLKDRIYELYQIPKLAEIIRQKSQEVLKMT